MVEHNRAAFPNVNPGKRIPDSDRRFIVLVCAFAALRILVFSAAFPFFNNVDEFPHVDTVVKYARGFLPRAGSNRFDEETVRLIAMYGTNEYYRKAGQDVRTPSWKGPEDSSRVAVKTAMQYWAGKKNYEARAQPFLYYGIAGLWYNTGKLVGIRGGFLLYWIRLLNPIVYVLFMLLAYWFCKRFYIDKPALRLGVLLFLACFPQDLFYSVTNDIFSCLFFLFSFCLLMELYSRDRKIGFYALTGLALSATVLVKYINAPVFVLAVLVLSAKLLQTRKTGTVPNHVKGCLVFLASALLPVFLWMGRNVLLSAMVNAQLASVPADKLPFKPLSQMWNHPIFTAKGLVVFSFELLKTFWRGEFTWHLQRLKWDWMDRFYVLSSFVFLVGAFVQLLDRGESHRVRWIHFLNFSVFFSYVFMLAFMSILFQFGDHWIPSRFYPYFTFGRFMTGALFSFAVLYVGGLEWILAKIHKRISVLVVIGGIGFAVLVCEIWMSLDVFRSPYNFFHLLIK